MTDIGERKLKDNLLNLVQNDFEIFPEVRGKNLIHADREVKIDYMFHPKPQLIRADFEDIWFGVEVKHFGNQCNTEKMSRFIWQCITYVQSEFQVDRRLIRPIFVLGYSDIESALEFDATPEKCASREWLRLIHLAGLANVGMLGEYRRTKKNPLGGWHIRFSTTTWCKKRLGHYQKFNSFNIFNVNVGNCTG
jgi:hypothetical protein